MHKDVTRALGLLILTIAVGSILLYGYREAERRSRCSFIVAPNNRTKFSDVYVVIDHTESMLEADVGSAKEIVNNRILPNIGVNDTVSCYALGGKFQDSTNTVFRNFEQQPPGLENPQKLLEVVKAKGDLRKAPACDVSISQLIDEVKAKASIANRKREDWQNKIKVLARPAVDGSDYVGTFDAINRSMNNYTKQKDRESWLFVVGDLKNESKSNKTVRDRVAPLPHFDHIVLVYPINTDPKLPETEKFWEDYFEGKYEKQTFGEALQKNSLIAPNPLTGLDILEGENFWRVFLPYIVASIVIITVIWLGYFFLLSRVRAYEKRRVGEPFRS